MYKSIRLYYGDWLKNSNFRCIYSQKCLVKQSYTCISYVSYMVNILIWKWNYFKLYATILLFLYKTDLSKYIENKVTRTFLLLTGSPTWTEAPYHRKSATFDVPDT
jgi:hypothetical protein